MFKFSDPYKSANRNDGEDLYHAGNRRDVSHGLTKIDLRIKIEILILGTIGDHSYHWPRCGQDNSL